MENPDLSHVILVNEQDQPVGTAGKMKAHLDGALHRAFSVFIVNSRGEFLLQQRAADKYHSKGLWTNTCCSHPAPGETIQEAATRRLTEEMGITCFPEPVFSFIYKTELEDGLTEHEFDHVLIGFSDQDPVLNPEEAMDFRWLKMDQLQREIQDFPEKFTFWFRMIMQDYSIKLTQYIQQHESLQKGNI